MCLAVQGVNGTHEGSEILAEPPLATKERRFASYESLLEEDACPYKRVIVERVQDEAITGPRQRTYPESVPCGAKVCLSSSKVVNVKLGTILVPELETDRPSGQTNANFKHNEVVVLQKLSCTNEKRPLLDDSERADSGMQQYNEAERREAYSSELEQRQLFGEQMEKVPLEDKSTRKLTTRAAEVITRDNEENIDRSAYHFESPAAIQARRKESIM
ncbi:hypothetical protein MRX96_013372 [Rhipicephalus microplus]